nr:MAG TPA: hypothetical protein [Caudoviricetes sp.]
MSVFKVNKEKFNKAKDYIDTVLFNSSDESIYNDISLILYHTNKLVDDSINGKDNDEIKKIIESLSKLFLWSYDDQGKYFEIARIAIRNILESFCRIEIINFMTSSLFDGSGIELAFYKSVITLNIGDVSETDIKIYSDLLRMIITALQYFKMIQGQITIESLKLEWD